LKSLGHEIDDFSKPRIFNDLIAVLLRLVSRFALSASELRRRMSRLIVASIVTGISCGVRPFGRRADFRAIDRKNRIVWPPRRS
jgi:hypothetical protein